MRTVSLAPHCGDFCTERHNPGLKEIQKQLLSAVNNNEKVLVDRTGVKFMSVSFFDELMAPIVTQYTDLEIDRLIEFSAPLEKPYRDHLTRMRALRA